MRLYDIDIDIDINIDVDAKNVVGYSAGVAAGASV